MKTLLKLASCAALISASLSAHADWTVTGGYASLKADDSAADISLGAVYGGIGYTYERGDMTYMPELRVGTGVSDDTVFGVDVEVDSLIVASLRAQLNVNESFSVFLQPSYGRLEATASAGGYSETDDDWEFGIGGGASIALSNSVSLEAMYEAFDDTDVISIGVRAAF